MNEQFPTNEQLPTEEVTPEHLEELKEVKDRQYLELERITKEKNALIKEMNKVSNNPEIFYKLWGQMDETSRRENVAVQEYTGTVRKFVALAKKVAGGQNN